MTPTLTDTTGGSQAGRPDPLPAQGCPVDGFQELGIPPSPSLGREQNQIDYDDSFYSFVGCRCEPGYDNVYTVDATGMYPHATPFHHFLRPFPCPCDPLHEPVLMYVPVQAVNILHAECCMLCLELTAVRLSRC